VIKFRKKSYDIDQIIKKKLTGKWTHVT